MDRLKKYRIMYGLLKEIGIENAKTSLLEGYRVEHTSDLTDEDLDHLIGRLRDMKVEKANTEANELKHWRSNLLSLLNKYGVYVTNNDWSAVNKLLLNKKVAGKVLYEMDKKELQDTCLRMRAILMKREQIQDEETELAFQN